MAKSKKEYPAPLCLHCGEVSVLTTGREIFPNMSGLWDKNYYKCPSDCDAYVGVHKGTLKALGYPANAEVRKARSHVHKMIDPLWQNAWRGPSYSKSDTSDPKSRTIIQMSARHRVYKWLAHKMRISSETCHISMFGIEECREAYRFCRSVNYEFIRQWHKEQKKIAENGD